jgi:hypothetical protein
MTAAQREEGIVAANLRAMGPMIVAAMFEELKAFQVADKLVELFRAGMLPIQGSAGDKLLAYWREGANRLSEAERRDLYAPTLGIPGGEPAGIGNRDFDALWLRFVSAVSASPRRQAPLRKAARDLIGNLSQHRFGPAARRLRADIDAVDRLLREPDIQRACGARDMWQLIDRVASDQLGGARNTARQRRFARDGAMIVAWLAANLPRIEGTKGPQPDEDLVKACQRWLVDSGTGERERSLGTRK